jgi:hypothetical protein
MGSPAVSFVELDFHCRGGGARAWAGHAIATDPSVLVWLLMALSLVAASPRRPRTTDLRYRSVEANRAVAWRPSAARAASPDRPVDLVAVTLTALDGQAPKLVRYVRGRAVLLPLVSRTATGETALGVTLQLQLR